MVKSILTIDAHGFIEVFDEEGICVLSVTDHEETDYGSFLEVLEIEKQDWGDFVISVERLPSQCTVNETVV